MVVHRFRISTPPIVALLLGLALTTAPARAAGAAQARLVHCGEETCLLLSGHRPRADIMVRVGPNELAVEGGRTWRVAVPLHTARGWGLDSAYSLELTLIDKTTGLESKKVVILPPGALGRPVELASLVVRGH